MSSSIAGYRKAYHQSICRQMLRISYDKKRKQNYVNLADCGNKASIEIADRLADNLCGLNNVFQAKVAGQTTGTLFEALTKDFLEQAFGLLHHLRPGKWVYSTQSTISDFEQYEHLAYVKKVMDKDPALSAALKGDYLIMPDIVVGRMPVADEEINKFQKIVDEENIAAFSPLRKANLQSRNPILHASISCKWTIRSDRSQNTRTEALNLIRNRKGPLPHVAAVTAEPLPSRLATLALGTGDLDCVYHFALPELRAAIVSLNNEVALDLLDTMINGKRLRDISDLPFDLAI
ncbi:MAG: NgoMIV family type II restriction endonuclease [Anaerolineaceae bacterium]|jgi:hypothetical protein|nr:NgoMIV family type II restriction endonuclease [Anaerolineaceae bacterium]